MDRARVCREDPEGEVLVDKSIVEMTSVLYEGEDGGIVCSQR
jgi:hypothetical protein